MTTTQQPLPQYLYHGSLFEQKELMPGFKRSGKIVKWDQTESNVYLYATGVEDTAIELGFASAIEKIFDVTHFRCQGNRIEIETSAPITKAALANVVVYLYKIAYKEDDNWKKNDNKNNGMTTEYKTHKDIYAIERCEKVDITKWLQRFKIFVKRKNFPQSVALESLETNHSFSW